jgi:branched-chain amino acid transport system ATP-binding protein
MNFLEAHALEVSYGQIKAVKGVDIEVKQGELVCLIGANGAGKTTTLKALSGMLPPSQGEILFEGERITGTPSHVLVRRGIALVPEGRGIFGRLTVEENLRLGAYARRDGAGIRRDMERAYGLFPRLVSHPRLLLLDEPSMGLAPILVQKIFEIIRQIAAEGVTLLLVEQNAKLALQISHRGYVLESGRVALADTASALLTNPRVRQAYLGG